MCAAAGVSKRAVVVDRRQSKTPVHLLILPSDIGRDRFGRGARPPSHRPSPPMEPLNARYTLSVKLPPSRLVFSRESKTSCLFPGCLKQVTVLGSWNRNLATHARRVHPSPSGVGTRASHFLVMQPVRGRKALLRFQGVPSMRGQRSRGHALCTPFCLPAALQLIVIFFAQRRLVPNSYTLLAPVLRTRSCECA